LPYRGRMAVGASGTTYLSGIVAAHRAAAAEDQRDPAALIAQARSVPATRSFRAALVRTETVVIAEIKRRSPSRGDLAPGLDPVTIAAEYERGGAGCLSVLTDEQFFGGSASDLCSARAACSLPVLRKDFTVGEADVADARLMGADALLLIVAALSDIQLSELRDLASSLSLDTLVEVHDEEELERALASGADLVGVNQRDLRTFDVDTTVASRLASRIPSSVVAVAESGVKTSDDVERLADCGFQAVLVGETLVTAPDTAAAVKVLTGHRVGARGPSAAIAGS
jgi:indole-3-glycerol phosphate synthase